MTTASATITNWSLTEVSDAKQRLLNRVCATLLYEPRFYASADETQLAIRAEVAAVAAVDPEFVLKLALYARQDLNIRSTSNYLLALAALTTACRPHLKRYFGASIVRPDDLLEVVALTTAFDTSGKGKAGTRFVIPAALRKAIASRFATFSEYSLAKYQNKGKAKPGAGKENANANNGDGMEVVAPVGAEKPRLPTLKQLARVCHLSHDAAILMGLLGKRYPSTPEEYAASGLAESKSAAKGAAGEGAFDPARAGQRMSLKAAGTWEQALSAQGNTAAAWEALLDGRKLGYMALLRNLRNLLTAGISPAHHDAVLRRLVDEEAVAGSRLFPFRFLSAYTVLDELKGGGEPAVWACATCTFHNPVDARRCEMCGSRKGTVRNSAGRKGTVRNSAGRKGGGRKAEPGSAPAAELVDRYQAALDRAVRTAVRLNVKPVRGKTAVMCDVSGSMLYCKSQTAKGLGSLTTPMDISLLCGLLLREVCQEADVYAFGSRKTPESKPVHKLTDTDLGITDTGPGADGTPPSLLAQVAAARTAAHQHVAGCNEFFYELLEELMDAHEREVCAAHGVAVDEGAGGLAAGVAALEARRIDAARQPSSHQLERMVLFTDVMVDRLHEEQDGRYIPERYRARYAYSVDGILAEYRRRANPQFQFVVVDLFGSGKSLMSVEQGVDGGARDPNNVWVTGYSDSIFRFLADRGTQLEYVERIDEEKGLPE